MTSVMSVSRIPVPVRNFDVATQRRTISAKTRLERLRDEFQRRLLFEKHAKLHDFYTEKQCRETKADASHRFRSGETRHGHYRNPEVTADFFSEREALISGQKNEYTSPNNFSDVPGSFRRRPPLPPYPKRSAGRDRAHLLAPINPARPNRESPKLREGQAFDNGGLAPSPDNLDNRNTLRKLNQETVEQKLAPRPPPIVSRPKIMRPYVRNRTHQVQFQDETDSPGKGQFGQSNLERLKQQKLRQLNEEVSNGPNHSLRHPGQRVLASPGATVSAGEQDEMEIPPQKKSVISDFQRWQVEQNQERARRLQRLNERSQIQKGSSFHDENRSKFGQKEQSWARMEDDDKDSVKQNQIWRQKQQILQHHNRKEAAIETKLDDEEEDLENERLKQKERELQELIRRQEEELQKLRQEKFEEEEEEKLKEIENEKRQAKFRQQKQRVLEAEMSQQKMRHDPQTPIDKASEMTSSQTATRSRPTRRTSVASLPPKQMWEPEIDPNNEETAFYLQKAISEGKLGADEIDLVPCQVCGRSFASDRLPKHEKICSKESKKTRKVFDHVAMRYRGTDFENHIKRRESITEEPVDEKKSHWRTKHQNLIDTLKYAKKVTKVKSEGGSLSRLPPPPVTLNPDYIQCPHCQRRFNQKAADRHIPWCKDSKSRQPLKPKSQRQ